jgi:hypothetical protein
VLGMQAEGHRDFKTEVHDIIIGDGWSSLTL